jgi:hypothetical protein
MAAYGITQKHGARLTSHQQHAIRYLVDMDAHRQALRVFMPTLT